MADLITMLSAAAGAAPKGYEIQRSLRFNSADSAYLSRTFASAGNRRTWTWSGWVKRVSSGTTQHLIRTNTTPITLLRFEAGDSLYFYSVGVSAEIRTTALYRDFSAWYHVVLAVDTTQATSSNRIKLYVNGVQVTAFSTETYPSQNTELGINTASAHAIGATTTPDEFANQYLADVHFIDGSALTPSSFGENDTDTGVWQPKKYAGTYGTNGFYLNFSDNSNTTASTLGKDYSGNGNNWTPSGFSVTAGAGNDSLVDTPTQYGTDTGAGGQVRGNYATWNPLINGDSAANGNLDVTNDTARSTQALLQFDTYWEITSTGGTTTAGTVSATGTTNTTTIADTKTYGFRLTTAGTLDYINITDGGSFTNITTGLTGQQFIYASAASATTGSLNTGQRPFAATAPSGFKALVTTNLPEPTVVQGDEYFNTVLYTGTGSSQSITGVGFQPDFVWIKERNGAADHGLYDAVRGVQQQLESNTTTDETTESTGLTAFGSDGFTVGSLAQVNTSTDTYVAWNWKANGAGVSNTDGTITSTVSASIDSGFSIVTYTGTGVAGTVGHGLGVAPEIIIVKNRTTSNNWAVNVYNILGTTNNSLWLNLTNGVANVNTWWNSTAPAATVFSIGGVTNETNTSIDTFVAYCFAEVAGFSKFGSLTGNGSADGPFVFLGFRPAFVMLKRTDSTSNWTILDLKREGYNVDNDPLFPNLSDAETTTDLADLLSNGFKLRSTDASVNASAGTYIYMAFAENPVKFSLAR
jgi:hypothetical protein